MRSHTKFTACALATALCGALAGACTWLYTLYI
jgi:hypothetical protein